MDAAAGERPRGGARALPAEAPQVVREHLKLAAERVKLGVDGGGAAGVDGLLEAAQAEGGRRGKGEGGGEGGGR